MSNDALLISLLTLPFLGAVVAGLMPAHARNREAWLAAAIALSAHVAAWTAYPEMVQGQVLRLDLAWLPSLGLQFTLRLDGFSWVFSLLVTGIGFLVVLYARYYMSPSDPVPRFFAFFLAFMGAMLGVVLAGNLVQLVFFWELTSLFSFLLIGYWHRDSAAREGARMALIVTSAGGLCLFGGAICIGPMVGSYDLDVVLSSGDLIRQHALYLPALLLVLAGALTKSAQFPFHFWLPHAMAAPTPVSAFLHSAAMVKLGVFLMARLWPVLSGTDAWIWIVGATGLVTLVFGAYVAIFQHDMKGLLAYSTISHLGLITLLLGIGSPLAAVAAVFHMLNHATFKASLFMATGIVDHECGTRDMRRLSGLYRLMPITATLAMVSAAAMAGVPLLNGFLSKEMFFAETLGMAGPSRMLDLTLPYVATIWGIFSVAYSTRIVHDVFLGAPPSGLAKEPHEPPRWMRFPIELLVFTCLAVGIFPAVVIGPFLDIAVRAILGAQVPAYSLSVWHGFTTPFLMSLVAMLGGVTLYALLRRYLVKDEARVPGLWPFDARQYFERVLFVAGRQIPRWVEGFAGTRRLQAQLGCLVVIALFAALIPAWRQGLRPGSLPLTPIDIPFAIVCGVGALCALAAAWQARFHRFAALLLAGGSGLSVCLVFVTMAAPDLALTQLLVEIVTTVLLLLGLRWLPKRKPGAADPAALRRRARDLVIAVSCGMGLATLAYAVMTRPLPDNTISRFFVERALPEGGGANVVNVIIVDFRGFDTLVEISVLAVVGLTVFSLLRRFRPAQESLAAPDRQKVRADASDEMFVPAVIMRSMFPLIAIFSAYLLWRGHNAPGGGFAAGVAFAIAVILQYMAGGTRWAEDRLAIRPMRWMGLGLLTAFATGIGAIFLGHPFLTSHTAHLVVPLLGELQVPSAMLFDLGVFSLVVGATGLLLIALAHQSLRHPWN